jgi:hypothetical protein
VGSQPDRVRLPAARGQPLAQHQLPQPGRQRGRYGSSSGVTGSFGSEPENDPALCQVSGSPGGTGVSRPSAIVRGLRDLRHHHRRLARRQQLRHVQDPGPAR